MTNCLLIYLSMIKQSSKFEWFYFAQRITGQLGWYRATESAEHMTNSFLLPMHTAKVHTWKWWTDTSWSSEGHLGLWNERWEGTMIDFLHTLTIYILWFFTYLDFCQLGSSQSVNKYFTRIYRTALEPRMTFADNTRGRFKSFPVANFDWSISGSSWNLIIGNLIFGNWIFGNWILGTKFWGTEFSGTLVFGSLIFGNINYRELNFVGHNFREPQLVPNRFSSKTIANPLSAKHGFNRKNNFLLFCLGIRITSLFYFTSRFDHNVSSIWNLCFISWHSNFCHDQSWRKSCL
jgi:hypothetical protein